MVKKILIFLLAIVFLTGCASKRYAKKGRAFEEAGLYDKAAEMYYTSVVKNNKNVEAQIGLKKTGQLTLNKKLGHFNNFYNANETKEAVYKFIEAEKYYLKLKNIGTELNFPTHYRDYYQEVKDLYLEEIYGEALLLLDEEKFTEAEILFNEILEIQPGYMDVEELRNTAHYEPIYRNGKEHLLNGKYRSAYYAFDKILNRLNTYKNAVELKSEALSKALITIAIIDFKSHRNHQNEAQAIQSSVQKYLSSSSSPFIKLVDRENTQRITDEQLLTLEGKVDNKVSAQAGKMLGVKTLLTAEVTGYSVIRGSLKKDTKRGYLKEKIVTKKGETEEISYKYHKVSYYEYTQSNTVSCGVEFKLISAETGEILVADNFSETRNDEIHYADYPGEKRNLVPGYWVKLNRDSPNDVVKDDKSSKRELDRLLNASRKLKSVETLKKELNKELAQNIARKIESYDPEQN